MARLCHDLGCLRTQENILILQLPRFSSQFNADAALFTIHPYLLDLPPFLISRLQLISGSTKERMRETRAGKSTQFHPAICTLINAWGGSSGTSDDVPRLGLHIYSLIVQNQIFFFEESLM